MKHRKTVKLPLKTVYYAVFIGFIVVPILIVLVCALVFLNWEFKKQAINTIKQAQETIITELLSDINTMSMRLSHLIYTNNNEILQYVAKTDTADPNERYLNEQKLSQAVGLAIEPTKNTVSVGFYMKSGRTAFVKNEIKRTPEVIKQERWYQDAMANPNVVFIGAYDTAYMNDLFTGGKKDLLLLVYALAPDITLDRSEKIEMVTLYQSVAAADRIKLYNKGYIAGENRLGITLIRDGKGEVIFSTLDDEDLPKYQADTLCIATPLRYNGNTWYIENYIKPSHLMGVYWDKAILIMVIAIVVLALAGYYSRYFLKSMVKPIEEMSCALRKVEEGDLTVHILPTGQTELRTMIHSFNAMVRRLKALIEAYEDKLRSTKKNPQDYFHAIIRGELTPQEVHQESPEFFAESFALLGIWIESAGHKEADSTYMDQILCDFLKHPRFSSRCLLYMENSHFLIVHYRIHEIDYSGPIVKMVEELQKTVGQQYGLQLATCIGKQVEGPDALLFRIEEIRQKMCLRHLRAATAIIDLSSQDVVYDTLLEQTHNYKALAIALYLADEKNVIQEREKLLDQFSKKDLEEARRQIFAAILAIGIQFTTEQSSFADVFGQKYDYIKKVERIEDLRGLRLWVTNYLAWIMDYSASKLNVMETDVVIKAKRYSIDHFDDPDLGLGKVAEYVGLNEKYFASRFSKEAGETFITYLTQVRMQKARELLKTTHFKVYEVAEMVGYHNVEHFNRVFKKNQGMTPAQYRKEG
ncbi:MAG: helix-turn-helix domain-containing protein [Cellulosilyticaceae bacterium]